MTGIFLGEEEEAICVGEGFEGGGGREEGSMIDEASTDLERDLSLG